MSKIAIKKLPNSEVSFTTKVPAKEMNKALDTAAEAYSRKHPIPGFRPGKASREVVEKHAGAEKLFQEAVEIAVKKTYVKTITENELRAIGAPKIDLKAGKPGEDLEFEAKVAVFPEIEITDVKKLKVEKPAVDKIKVKDEAVDKVINQLRTMRAKLVTVNRAAEKGDRVEVDFKLFMGKAPYEGGTSKNHPIIIGEKKFIPGFEEQLIGLKKDDKKKFEIPFPKKYHDSKLAGKKGEFEVVMKLVQEQELPELNDEFAQNAGAVKTVTEFKKNITDNLKMEKKFKMVDEALNKLLEEIVKTSKTEIPKIMLEDEKNKMLQELENNISGMGLTLEGYLEHLKTTKEELMKGWDQDAEKRIKIGLAIRKIAEKENLRAEEKEIKAKADQLKQQLANAPHQVDPAFIDDYAIGLTINDKVIAWLKKEILGVK